VDLYTRDLIEALKKPKDLINEPKVVVIIENFIRGWKQMKERTSAGISGMHFGHLKAYSIDRNLEEFKASITHISCTRGYSLLE